MNHPILHFDISGPDDERLRSFYGDVFGWEVDPMGPGYALVATGGGLRGRVVMEPVDNGWVTKAQIADPAGNVVTLIQT